MEKAEQRIQAAENADLLGRLGEAEQLYRQAAAILETTLGPNHLEVAITYHCLAQLLERQGKSDDAFDVRLHISKILAARNVSAR